MENLKAKQDKWNELKEGFMAHFPEDVVVNVDWGTEHPWFHPKVTTDIGVIKGQCGLDSNNVYAIRLFLDGTNSEIYLEEKNIKYLFENIEYFRPVLNRIIEQQKVVQELKERLDATWTHLIYSEFEKVAEKHREIKSKNEVRRSFESLFIDLENTNII
jgi:hypothetical protein